MTVSDIAADALLVFQEHDWEWYDGPPDQERMEDTIWDLLEYARGHLNEGHEEATIRTGRLRVDAERMEDGSSTYMVSVELGSL